MLSFLAGLKLLAVPARHTAVGLNTCAKKEMLLADFVQWWQGPIGTRVRTRGAALAARHGIVVCDAVDNVSAGGTLEEVRDDRERGEGAGEDEEEEVYYLKDWNFTKEYPEYGLYPRPDLFAEDWLNWYQRNSATDHRFVYLGPAGSVTPLHTDTLDSFSWSANIAGYKRWHLLPPSSTHALHTGSGTQLLDVRLRPITPRPKAKTLKPLDTESEQPPPQNPKCGCSARHWGSWWGGCLAFGKDQHNLAA